MTIIYSTPGGTFATSVTDAPTGIVGVIGYRVLASDNTVLIPRTTAGIIELPAGSGTYVADDVAIPDTAVHETYTVIWDDGAGFTDPSDSLIINASGYAPNAPNNPETIHVTWRPTVQEVADQIRSRTIDQFNHEVGTFNDETTPTGQNTEGVIDSAVETHATIFGTDVKDAEGADPSLYRKLVANATSLLAAAMIERTFFAKEVARENSPYKELMTEYERLMLWLGNLLGIAIPGITDDTGGEDVGGSHIAVWGNEIVDPYSDMMTRPT